MSEELARLTDLLEEAYFLISKMRGTGAESRVTATEPTMSPVVVHRDDDAQLDAVIASCARPERAESAVFGVDLSVVDAQIRGARELLRKGRVSGELVKAHRETRRVS